MIDGRGILRYSRDVQRDRRTGKDNFLCKLAMHLARVRVLKRISNRQTSDDGRNAFSPCEGIETSSRPRTGRRLDDALSPCEGIETRCKYCCSP